MTLLSAEIVPPDPKETNLFLLLNQVYLGPSSSGYADLYSSDSGDTSVFEDMVSSNKTAKTINTYFVLPPSVALVSVPNKVLKKRRKTRLRK